MKYRIVSKLYANEKDAVKECNKLLSMPDVVSNPRVVQSPVNRCWEILLYECENKTRAEQGAFHYQQNGIEVFIQKVD